jgi:putative ABC transport system permease protein
MRTLYDLRLGWRALRTAPLTTAAALLVIALGTGANTAVVAVTYGILMRPFPYPDVSRLAIVSVSTSDGADFGVPLGEVGEWRRRLRTVEDLAGFATGEIAVRGAGEPRLVQSATVTEAFFDVLGVAPVRGRLQPFREDAGVAVLSERLSAQLEHRDGLRIGDCSCTIAAVMPAKLSFPSDQIDAWLPASREDGTLKVRMVARLRPGVSPAQLREDAARVLREIRGQEYAAPGAAQPTVTSFEDALVGAVRPVLGASLAGALLVLLVTCGNVATLLLGRAILRRRESAVRLALGAGRWRIVRGSLAESFLLAAIGSLLGLWLAGIAVRILGVVAAGVIPRWHAVAIDPPVLAASAAMVFLVAFLCGTAPALHAARNDLATALRGRGAGEPRTRRFLSLLVVGQIAVSIVLLASAVLLARTVQRLLAGDLGIEPGHVLVARLSLGERSDPFVQEVLDRVRALPGVEAAGLGSGLPPSGLPFQIFVRRISGTRDEGMSISVVSATPGFLDALGARTLSGRLFAGTEEWSRQPVVLLSESASRLALPGEDLAGRELPMALPPIAEFAAPPRVLGVIRDVKYAGLDQPAAAALYLPWTARPAETAYLAVRTAGDPAALAPAVRRILREIDPELSIPQIRSLEDEMALSIVDRRLRVLPALGFAAVALAVALTGIFALFARAAAERRREFAIRIALGAPPARVQTMVLQRAAVLTGLGIVTGLAGTVMVASGLRSLLFGVGPHDPLTLAGVVLFVAVASVLSAWVPARRAARAEPLELLRAE